MTIYLYVKTHNKTGLKYLGKTKSKNPHRYQGSGVYWKNHLKVHGNDYITEILKECDSNEEIEKWGIYYSDLWNIVKSNEWANLKPETGDGGTGPTWTEQQKINMSIRNKGQKSLNKGKTYEQLYGKEKTLEKIKKFKETMRKISESKPKKEEKVKLPYGKNRIGMTYEQLYGEDKAKEMRLKLSESNKGENNPSKRLDVRNKISEKNKGRINPNKGKTLEEICGKDKAENLKELLKKNNRGENNPMFGKVGAMKGKTHSAETRQKIGLIHKGKKREYRPNLQCPHCNKSLDPCNAIRWHFDKCKFKQ